MGFKFWFHMPSHMNAMHPFVIRNVLGRLGYEIIDKWSETMESCHGKGLEAKLH